MSAVTRLFLVVPNVPAPDILQPLCEDGSVAGMVIRSRVGPRFIKRDIALEWLLHDLILPSDPPDMITTFAGALQAIDATRSRWPSTVPVSLQMDAAPEFYRVVHDLVSLEA